MAQLASDVDTGVVLIHVEAGPAAASCFLFFTLAPHNDTHESELCISWFTHDMIEDNDKSLPDGWNCTTCEAPILH